VGALLGWARRRVAGARPLRQTVGALADASARSRNLPDERRDLPHAGMATDRTRRRRRRLRKEVQFDGGDGRRSAEIRLGDARQTARQRLRRRLRATFGRRRRLDRRWPLVRARPTPALSAAPLGNGRHPLQRRTRFRRTTHVTAPNQGGLERSRARPVLGRRSNELVDAVGTGADRETGQPSIGRDVRRYTDLVVALRARRPQSPLLVAVRRRMRHFYLHPIAALKISLLAYRVTSDVTFWHRSCRRFARFSATTTNTNHADLRS